MKNPSQLLEDLEAASCTLKCVNVPTGGDDFDITWEVIEHYMDKPNERVIGCGTSPIDALNDAFSN